MFYLRIFILYKKYINKEFYQANEDQLSDAKTKIKLEIREVVQIHSDRIKQ